MTTQASSYVPGAIALLAASLALTGAAVAQDAKTMEGGLGAAPPSQGEAWMESTGAQDPTLGERRTEKQKNAAETRAQGRIGSVPDAASGESGLKPGTAESVKTQSGSGASGGSDTAPK
ncbi:hypothetical protein [Azospirillum argentinense]|uniref:Uncharacterized protein n=2 Tax=Azospirillum TaxID=191 RepID=A0A2K1FYK2_9PROT|nr:hypothetical protein [Azospirillum argentinense]KAA1054382.1 hypothetical protein FH063_006638 [Azospirillum argentinense]PNQ97614.1 hypothetical protein C1S70_17530 [Azospirillum argentinense]QCN95736.1 hypothetical protein D3093_10980 [Azospirillum argentinense]QCO02891.1 hypothetical protein D3867_13250 [Azospirillum argentinense]